MNKSECLTKIISSWKLVGVAIISLLIGGIAVQLIPSPTSVPKKSSKSTPPLTSQKKQTLWTCSMHPQVRQPKPGKCPICFMDLIPVKTEQLKNGHDATGLTLSPRARKLAEVATMPVERKFVEKAINMVGMIDYDESRIAHITARMPGRVDILYVNYTGIAVRKGDHMVGYYSPDLYVAQKELLQSARAYKQMSPEPNKTSLLDRVVKHRNINEKDILNSVIKRLKLWGLTETNIKNILKTGKVVDLVTLYAPISGIVIHKSAIEGKYFKTGDSLFTIADLSRVWIKLEAYESDIPWLHYGQMVKFRTKSYPGEVFKGRISFIDPFLDPMTRTIKLRVDAPNPSGKLKPNMFVNAVVYSDVSQGGKAIAPDLIGKWICPMHPDVIKEKPEKCDICGMKLVAAETLGYTPIKNLKLPLVIPASAPLITGERAVVYVNDKPGHFYGQEIELGPRAGNYYIVKSGLKAGQQVVTNGNFKIDSALQIQAKPSMMGKEPPEHKEKPARSTVQKSRKPQVPAMVKEKLHSIYSAYFKIQQGLANDDLAKAKSGTGELLSTLKKAHAHGMDKNAARTFQKLTAKVAKAAAGINSAKDINAARDKFNPLSTSVNDLFGSFGTAGQKVYQFFCPMVFNNKGAYWFQNNPDLVNPYYGEVMLKCGEKIKEFKK